MYTKKNIAHIVRYSRTKGVKIVPEFDPVWGLGFAWDFGSLSQDEEGGKRLYVLCPNCTACRQVNSLNILRFFCFARQAEFFPTSM
jgi:hypothetical protein